MYIDLPPWNYSTPEMDMHMLTWHHCTEKICDSGKPKNVQMMSSFALDVAGVAVLVNSPLKFALNRESTRVDFPQPVSPESEQGRERGREKEREREGEGEGEEDTVHRAG